MPTTSFFLRDHGENFFTLHDDTLEIRYTQDDSFVINNLTHNEVKIETKKSESTLQVTAFQGNKKLFSMEFDDEIDEIYVNSPPSIYGYDYLPFSLIVDNLKIVLKAHPSFVKFLLDKFKSKLFLKFKDAEKNHAIKIAKPLQDLLKEAISHDNIVYNIDYYVLNLDESTIDRRLYSYNETKQKTLLYKDNLIAVLNQKPPLIVNDPLTRQEIKTITKIKFVEPIPIKSNLISTSNRKRSRSIGGGKKSKQTRKTKNKK